MFLKHDGAELLAEFEIPRGWYQVLDVAASGCEEIGAKVRVGENVVLESTDIEGMLHVPTGIGKDRGHCQPACPVVFRTGVEAALVVNV